MIPKDRVSGKWTPVFAALTFGSEKNQPCASTAARHTRA